MTKLTYPGARKFCQSPLTFGRISTADSHISNKNTDSILVHNVIILTTEFFLLNNILNILKNDNAAKLYFNIPCHFPFYTTMRANPKLTTLNILLTTIMHFFLKEEPIIYTLIVAYNSYPDFINRLLLTVRKGTMTKNVIR